MGYQHRLYKTACGSCKVSWLLFPSSWNDGTMLPRTFTCNSCGAHNTTKRPNLLPNIPRLVYCGHQRNQQLEIFPFPLDRGQCEGAYPYSVRSFLRQVSQQLGGCYYSWESSTELMGEPLHRDSCGGSSEWYEEGRERCHVLSGWTRGKDTCDLWERLKTYCQTVTEQRFLWAYLSLVKGRNFPMLLPQTRIGIAERRRPDFVAFVPLQYLKYKRYAIELDGAHREEHRSADQVRDLELAAENYDVISLRPDDLGYFPEVQKLVERFSVEMTEAERSAWDYATEIEIASWSGPPLITDDDIPF